MTAIRVRAVGRAPGEPRAVIVHLTDIPTNEDLAAVQVAMDQHFASYRAPLVCDKCGWSVQTSGADPTECPKCGAKELHVLASAKVVRPVSGGNQPPESVGPPACVPCDWCAEPAECGTGKRLCILTERPLSVLRDL